MMKTHCIRLVRGQDLLGQIRQYCIIYDIDAAVVISCVGCVRKAVIRDASGVTVNEINENMEIICVNGTVSKHRIHLHVSFSKKDLSVIAGHLMEGCIINTTCELVLLELPGTVFKSIYDETTGYEELDVRIT